MLMAFVRVVSGRPGPSRGLLALFGSREAFRPTALLASMSPSTNRRKPAPQRGARREPSAQAEDQRGRAGAHPDQCSARALAGGRAARRRRADPSWTTSSRSSATTRTIRLRFGTSGRRCLRPPCGGSCSTPAGSGRAPQSAPRASIPLDAVCGGPPVLPPSVSRARAAPCRPAHQRHRYHRPHLTGTPPGALLSRTAGAPPPEWRVRRLRRRRKWGGGVTPGDRVREALRRHGSKGSGSSWQCPAHDDQRASLSVSDGEDGRVLLHCHVGCGPEAVVAAVGLTAADLFPQNVAVSRVMRRVAECAHDPRGPGRADGHGGDDLLPRLHHPRWTRSPRWRAAPLRHPRGV